MNVGLTRAKSSLWILGDSRALVQGEYWGKLISNAKSRDRYTDGDVLAQLGRPSVKRPGFDASKTASPLTLKPLQIEEPSVKEEKPDVEMLDYDDYESLPAQPDNKTPDSEDYEPPPAKLENILSSDDYEPPPAVPDNLPRRPGPSLGDVPPKALPPKPHPSYPQSSKPFNNTKAPTARVMGQPQVGVQQSKQPNLPLVNPRSIRGVNERGEVVPTSTGGVQRPVINSSSPSMERKPDNKRYLDLNSDHPAAKRVSLG
jgi:senataxin